MAMIEYLRRSSLYLFLLLPHPLLSLRVAIPLTKDIGPTTASCTPNQVDSGYTSEIMETKLI